MRKNWTKNDIEKAISYYNEDKNFNEIGLLLNRTEKSVSCKLYKLGYKDNNKFHEIIICKKCNNKFSALKSDNRKYCSKECAGTNSKINNLKEKIIELRNDGLSYKQITKTLQCSQSTVSLHCKNINLSTPISNSTHLSKDIIRLIKVLIYVYNVKDLVDKFKINRSTVEKYTKIERNEIRNIDNLFIKRVKKTNNKFCLNCGVLTTNSKFCSDKCVKNFQFAERIKKWKNGKHNGMRGKSSTVRWIKTYMINKHGEKCMECGWSERNKHTGNIPIELEHIDGNFKNNNEDNLKLLCPNCHSLTPTYKGANKNNGRPRAKYYRGT